MEAVDNSFSGCSIPLTMPCLKEMIARSAAIPISPPDFIKKERECICRWEVFIPGASSEFPCKTGWLRDEDGTGGCLMVFELALVVIPGSSRHAIGLIEGEEGSCVIGFESAMAVVPSCSRHSIGLAGSPNCCARYASAIN